MIVSEIELFEVLSKEIGKEKAKSIVEYVEHKVDKRLEEKTNVFATKEDIARLETKLTRSIYVVGLVQYLAILASLVAVVKYLL